MKIIKLLLVMAVICTLSMDCFAQADSNKVTRTTLVGAIRKVQADSVKLDTVQAVAEVVAEEATGLSKDTLKCNKHTTSIVLFTYNPYDEHDKPYSITFSKDSMKLEVYCDGVVVYRNNFGYDGITYQKLLAIINLQQLVSVVPYGTLVSGSSCTTMSVYQNGLCCFTASDNSGVLNVKGSFEPLVQYMQKLIPNLHTIIDKCEEMTPNSDK